MYYYTIPEYTVLYEHQTRIYEYKLVQQLHALALDGHGTHVYWVLSSTSSFSSGWKLCFIMPKVRREIVKETSQGKLEIELNQWPGNVGRLHWKSSLFLSLKPTLKWSQADPISIGTCWLAGTTTEQHEEPWRWIFCITLNNWQQCNNLQCT
jgi:hypothetical protein